MFEPAQIANADFVFIDAGSPDSCDRQHFAAYARPRCYGRDITRWILERRIQKGEGETIDSTRFVATFTASRHNTGAQVEAVYNRITQAIEEGVYKSGNYQRPACAQLVKDIISQCKDPG